MKVTLSGVDMLVRLLIVHVLLELKVHTADNCEVVQEPALDVS